jgi:hypothetical protein
MNPFSTCLMNFYRSMTFTWNLNLICVIKYFTGILYWTYVIEVLLSVFPEIVSMGANPGSLCCVYNFWINLTTSLSLRDKKNITMGVTTGFCSKFENDDRLNKACFLNGQCIHALAQLAVCVCGGGGGLIANSLCAGGAHKPICQGPYSSLFCML